MLEDILHWIRVGSRISDFDANEGMHNQKLLVEDMCYHMCGNLLVRLGMLVPDHVMNDALKGELERESEYDRHDNKSNQFRCMYLCGIPNRRN